MTDKEGREQSRGATSKEGKAKSLGASGLTKFMPTLLNKHKTSLPCLLRALVPSQAMSGMAVPVAACSRNQRKQKRKTCERTLFTY